MLLTCNAMILLAYKIIIIITALAVHFTCSTILDSQLGMTIVVDANSNSRTEGTRAVIVKEPAIEASAY